jgi:hypothetical protein
MDKTSHNFRYDGIAYVVQYPLDNYGQEVSTEFELFLRDDMELTDNGDLIGTPIHTFGLSYCPTDDQLADTFKDDLEAVIDDLE